MLVIVRALAWSSLFVGFVLVWLPARTLAAAGIARPATIGARELAGALATLLGATLAAWCVLTFATVGRGTPAPFDPPQRLVVRGPYRYVRNPMYLGAALALAGAALVYAAWVLVGYTVLFLLVMQAFVLLHEEPALRARFGEDYAAYCANVRRWWPRRSAWAGR